MSHSARDPSQFNFNAMSFSMDSSGSAVFTDSDFQKFVQNPNLLKIFVNTHHVFDVEIRTAGPWASLMTTNDGGDPPNWLLTFSHSRTSNMAITSQPLVPDPPDPPH